MQYRQWQEALARQAHVEGKAQRALAQRHTEHFQEILDIRGLDPSIPLHALWLPRPAKPPRSVAHGWGNAPVGAKSQE